MKQIQFFFLFCLFAGNALSQSSTEFTHSVKSQVLGAVPAKDFWVAIPMIYNTGDSGKYAEITIASQSATTVHIRGSKIAPVDKKIKPMEQFVYKVETQDSLKHMEMRTSAVVEDKGIHIWSDGADLSVYLYTRNAISAGGTMILPTSSWGKEYSVAAFQSYWELGDKPGEFTIIACEDSTEVTVIAPVELRTSTHKVIAKDTPFKVLLTRGKAIQFMSVFEFDWVDLSGTSVTSSKPVGVISAVQCAYIEFAGTGCDFMCEMMPPIRSWGKKYIATDRSNGQGTWYSILASQDNQQISGYVDQVLQKNEPYFVRRYGGMLFQSDAPFLVTMYPAFSFGQGRPSMVCLSPVESNIKELIFQFPSDTTTNLVDVVYRVNARMSTKLDGVILDSIDHGGKFAPTGFQLTPRTLLGKGVHRITSDSSISFLAQGFTSTSSFAWSSTVNSLGVDRQDTLPPLAMMTGDCNMSRVSFTDTQLYATKIMAYSIDSLDNLRFEVDTSFIPGDLHSTFYYTLRLNDRSKPGMARVSVSDRVGNQTTVTSSIDARPNPSAPAKLVIPFAGSTIPNFRTFNLMNSTITPLTLTGPTGLRLASGNQGFTLVSPDLSDLPKDSVRTFTVRYVAADSLLRRDTIVYGDECTFLRMPLESKDVGPIAGTAGVDFGCLTIGTSRDDIIRIDNNGLFELTVQAIAFDDAVHFSVVSPVLPYTIPPNKLLGATIRYSPDVVDTNCTTARITTQELGELTATVCGCGLSPSAVKDDPSANEQTLREALRAGRSFAWLAPTPNPANLQSSVRFVFGLQSAATVKLELFDVEGKVVASISSGVFSGGEHEVFLSTTGLAAGSYLYRYTVNGTSFTGKLTLR